VAIGEEIAGENDVGDAAVADEDQERARGRRERVALDGEAQREQGAERADVHGGVEALNGPGERGAARRGAERQKKDAGEEAQAGELGAEIGGEEEDDAEGARAPPPDGEIEQQGREEERGEQGEREREGEDDGRDGHHAPPDTPEKRLAHRRDRESMGRREARYKGARARRWKGRCRGAPIRPRACASTPLARSTPPGGHHG
jgi:hypothetical protein